MSQTTPIQLLSVEQHAADATPATSLQVANDADLNALAYEGVTRIDLHFPKFSDGRAFSQAVELRRRHGFQGEIRATGDVLVDQVVQMHRTGFTSAVLRADQDPAVAARQFTHFPAGYYQGDAQAPQARFRQAA